MDALKQHRSALIKQQLKLIEKVNYPHIYLNVDNAFDALIQENCKLNNILRKSKIDKDCDTLKLIIFEIQYLFHQNKFLEHILFIKNAKNKNINTKHFVDTNLCTKANNSIKRLLKFYN